MTSWTSFAFGAFFGVLAYFLWDNRAALGFAVDHRDQLDAANRIVNDVKELWP